MRLCRFLAYAALLLAAPATTAHDMWIMPPDSLPAAGDLVEVRLRVVGDAGGEDPVARDSRRIVRFTAYGPDAEVPILGLDGAATGGYFRPEKPGPWVLAYESTTAYSQLPAERFTAYLEEEGLDSVLRLRRQKGDEDQPGRELYSRSLKSLAAVGTAYPAAEYARVGLPLELVLEAPPAAGPAAGRSVVLRLFLRGEPESGAMVDVRRLDRAEPALAGRTDAEGRIGFQLGPGSWLAGTVHMEPSTSEEADWRSIFSTLTFVIPDRAPPPGADR